MLDERLAVMDSTAATLCRDNGLPILVFDLGQPANIAKPCRARPSAPLSKSKNLKNSYFPPILS